MQKLFDEVSTLDKRCYEKFALSEDILMEHAANGMAEYIRKKFDNSSTVVVVCGSGNNGADGIALARLLQGDYDVKILFAKRPKSEMALIQAKRAKSIGVDEIENIQECDVLVDALVGTGFNGEFNPELKELLRNMNEVEAFKIACDVPSGINQNGECADGTFIADTSLTMGALKKSMFLDAAKEHVGDIEVLNLGVSRDVYEGDSKWCLLDEEDILLPYRRKKDSHKGDYGHLCIASGEKSGAGILSGLSALRFGSGLVTLIGFEDIQIPEILMYSHELPKSANALAIGMGLGYEFSDIELDKFLDNDYPIVADADVFYMSIIHKILKRDKVVLTPHPKEFVELLKVTGMADISVAQLQKDRFKYVEEFCLKYQKVTLLLKGSNVIIGQNDRFFINPHGSSILAKAGSGDVLSGLIGALLSQGYEPIEAAKNASLTHTKLSKNYSGADFSLTPYDLIDQIGKL